MRKLKKEFVGANYSIIAGRAIADEVKGKLDSLNLEYNTSGFGTFKVFMNDAELKEIEALLKDIDKNKVAYIWNVDDSKTVFSNKDGKKVKEEVVLYKRRFEN